MTEEASSLYGCEAHSHETNREAEQRVKKNGMTMIVGERIDGITNMRYRYE